MLDPRGKKKIFPCSSTEGIAQRSFKRRSHSYSSYLARCVAIELLILEQDPVSPREAYRPLGSVCFDHVGVQRMTVEAH